MDGLGVKGDVESTGSPDRTSPETKTVEASSRTIM